MTRRQQLLDLLRRVGQATFGQVRDTLEVSDANASMILAEARADGAVKRTGKRLHYLYEIDSPRPPRPTGRPKGSQTKVAPPPKPRPAAAPRKMIASVWDLGRG